MKDYEININSIDYNSRQDNKDFVIEITDQELLSKTNGIIQGMSAESDFTGRENCGSNDARLFKRLCPGLRHFY